MPTGLRAILADLDRHAELFDLSGSLGAELCDETVTGLILQIADQSDPDGNPWPELSAAYAERKGSDYISFLHGLMDDPEQLAGERTFARELATMTYGTSQAARDELDWFEQGDPARNRPPRPLWGLSAETTGRLDAACEKHFDAGTR